MHRPWVLILIGVLAFAASLYWLYSQNRGVVVLVESGGPSRSVPVDKVSTTEAVKNTRDSSDMVTDEVATRQTPPTALRRESRSADTGSGLTSTPTYQAPIAEVPRTGSENTINYPAGHLSISGRVLDPGGTPLADIRVVAQPRGIPSNKNAHETRSNSVGVYEMTGLAQGEYYVRAIGVGPYTTSGGLFRAGMQSADIVFHSSGTIRVVGRVTESAGLPLAKVEVIPYSRDAATVWTDAKGNFRTELPGVRAGTSSSVLFRLEGYQEERVHVTYNDVNATGEAVVDIELSSLAGTVEVSGRLRGADGALVAGELVQLDSPSLDNHYRETSAADGSFRFPAVEPGGDYRLTINPRSAYDSYSEQPITIQSTRMAMDVTLEPLPTGRVTGRMINADERALSGFRMWLISNRSRVARIEVISDDGGNFTIENAPAGDLTFVTQSQPSMSVTGITLEPDDSTHAELVLDWGDHKLAGRVINNSRRPVSGASVHFSGRYVGRGIQSSSSRSTTTDSEGNFRFSELGSGMHTLTVRMNGFETATKAIDVGSYSSSAEVVLMRSSK